MKKYISSLILAGALLSFSGCNKYLDKAPDDRTQLTDIATIKELITSGYPDYAYAPIFELRSDNMQDKGNRIGSPNPVERQMYTWEEVVQSSYQDSPQGFWRDSYSGVAAANQALRSIEQLTHGKKEEIDEARGEALMLRAYHYYMLAQAFTIPYDPNTAQNELGIPTPNEPEDVLIKDYERGTLQETYDQIVKDFEEGFTLLGSNYKQAKYHFTPQAAAAFGTRLYRTLGEWDKVIKYGKIALGAQPQLILRDVNGKYVPLPYDEKKSIWGSNTEECNFLCQVSISGWTRNFVGRYGIAVSFRDFMRAPSGKKPNNFLGKNPALPFFGGEVVPNIPKIGQFFKYTNITAGTGYLYSQFALFTAEETLFNLAEGYIMKQNFAEAEQLLQMYISKWMEGYKAADSSFKITEEKITNFYTGNTGKVTKDPIFGLEITTFNPFYETTEKQEMYLRAIADAKRYTFLHEGLRWLDNRQYRMDIIHNSLKENDTVEEYHVLRGDSHRYAYQLPTNVLTYLDKNPGYDQPIETITK